MIIYLVRHGEIDNPNNVLYGRLPGFHLSEEGIAHINELAQKLKKSTIHIDKIFCSPMERTQETAAIISQAVGASVRVEEQLNESEFGQCLGMSMNKFERGLDKGMLEGMVESLQSSGGRIVKFIQSMTDDGTYILVSHADPITGCLMLLGNLKRKEISFPRGGIIKITKTGNDWKIGQLNQI